MAALLLSPPVDDRIRRKLRAARGSQTAAILQRFFRTGHGEYKGTSSIPILLRSPVNEERLLALAMPVDAFKRGGRAARLDRVGG